MKSQRDTYKNRPPLAEILERFDEVEVRRWWPKMSPRDRLAVAECDKGSLAKWWSRLLAARVPIDDDVPEDPEADHARDVAGERDVRNWLRRLRRVLADTPRSVWLLAGDKTLVVHAHPPDSTAYDMSDDLEIERIFTDRVMTREWHS